MQNFAKTDLPETRSNPNIGLPNPRAELMVESPESAGKPAESIHCALQPALIILPDLAP